MLSWLSCIRFNSDAMHGCHGTVVRVVSCVSFYCCTHDTSAALLSHWHKAQGGHDRYQSNASSVPYTRSVHCKPSSIHFGRYQILNHSDTPSCNDRSRSPTASPRPLLLDLPPSCLQQGQPSQQTRSL